MTASPPPRKSYVHDLLALLAEHAKRGVNACPQIVDVMYTVPDALIPADQFSVWAKMKELASLGTAPTIPSLRRNLPAVPGEYWVGLRSEEASINDVRDAVLAEGERAQYVRLSNNLRRMITDNVPFPKIREEIGNVLDESLSGAPEPTNLRDVDVMARIDALRDNSLPVIRTPWNALNDHLGGGFFMGDDLAMTAILAMTSVGKTRFSQQIAWQASVDGHWVIVFAGESNALAYSLSLSQLIAFIPKAALLPGRMNDRHYDLIRKASQAVKDGNIHVFDRSFSVNVIRAVMSRMSRQLKEAKGAGRAAPHAQLLVIVDNVDHAIDGGSEKEWQELEQAAKGLYNTAQRLNSHIILLSQAKPAGFNEGYPPGLTSFSRANLIGSHCSNVIGLYRPVTYEQVNAEAGSVKTIPKVSVSKARFGRAGTYACVVDDEIGRWE